MAPLLETIASHVPPPSADPSAPFSMGVAMLERDPYLGRIALGRVASGRVRVGDKVRRAGGRAGQGRGPAGQRRATGAL